MGRWSVLKEIIKVYREGEYLGDLSTLRASLNLGSFEPTPEVRSFLDSWSDVPDFSAFNFESMPEGSLGWAYNKFLACNGLKPFRFSGRYLDLMNQHKLVVRYASVHDIFHVLTGYDTSLAGETGVWAFVAGQGFSPNALTAAKLTQILYPIISPFQRKWIRAAYLEGRKNGASARCLIAVDFKNEFLCPLEEIRSRYNVKPTQLTKFLSQGE